MKYLALTLYTLSTAFVWFFLGDLAFKVDPRDAVFVFCLLLTQHITKLIIRQEIK